LQYTEEQQASFKQQYAVRRKRQITMAIPLVVFFAGTALLGDEKTGLLLGMPRAVTMAAFTVVLGSAIIFSLRNWRCPACNKFLGSGRHRFCSNCGVALK
jgi:hypothetical protein